MEFIVNCISFAFGSFTLVFPATLGLIIAISMCLSGENRDIFIPIELAILAFGVSLIP